MQFYVCAIRIDSIVTIPCHLRKHFSPQVPVDPDKINKIVSDNSFRIYRIQNNISHDILNSPPGSTDPGFKSDCRRALIFAGDLREGTGKVVPGRSRKFLLKPVPRIFLAISIGSLLVDRHKGVYMRRATEEKCLDRKERQRSRWPRRASTASRGAQPLSKWKWDFAFYLWPVTSAPWSRTSVFSWEDACSRCLPINRRDPTENRHADSSVTAMTVLQWQSGEPPQKSCEIVVPIGKSARREQV